MGRNRTWTDDDLREAVARSASMAEVVRRLRLRRGGGSYTTVRTRMEILGLRLGGQSAPTQQRLPVGATSGGGPTPAGDRRSWNEDQLRAAVAQARSLNDVFTRLGLRVGGSQWLVIRGLIQARAWSTQHWVRPLGPAAIHAGGRTFRDAMANADLEAVVAGAASRADVIRALGFEPSTDRYRVLREWLEHEGIAIDHFEPRHTAMQRSPRRRYRQPLDEILVKDSTYADTTTLKRRLVEAGLREAVCAECGIDSWNGRPITLHLDHINGIRNDHRLENLRLLCPNCHSQTDTYCGRNSGRYMA